MGLRLFGLRDQQEGMSGPRVRMIWRFRYPPQIFANPGHQQFQGLREGAVWLHNVHSAGREEDFRVYTKDKALALMAGHTPTGPRIIPYD